MLELILLLLPGYIFLKVTEQDRAMRRDLQWPFLFDVALYSLLFILISRFLLFLILLLLEKCNFSWVEFSRSLWHVFAPQQFSFTVLLGSFLAGCAGMIPRVRQWITKPIDDPFYGKVSAFLVKKATLMIETDGGRVYIGILVEATTEQHHIERIFTLAHYYSGFRDENRILNINTIYNADSDDRIEISFPFREIVSFREFNNKFFGECASNGLVKITTKIPDNKI